MSHYPLSMREPAVVGAPRTQKLSPEQGLYAPPSPRHLTHAGPAAHGHRVTSRAPWQGAARRPRVTSRTPGMSRALTASPHARRVGPGPAARPHRVTSLLPCCP